MKTYDIHVTVSVVDESESFARRCREKQTPEKPASERAEEEAARLFDAMFPEVDDFLDSLDAVIARLKEGRKDA